MACLFFPGRNLDDAVAGFPAVFLDRRGILEYGYVLNPAGIKPLQFLGILKHLAVDHDKGFLPLFKRRLARSADHDRTALQRTGILCLLHIQLQGPYRSNC